jgi:hypothetical protein
MVAGGRPPGSSRVHGSEDFGFDGCGTQRMAGSDRISWRGFLLPTPYSP